MPIEIIDLNETPILDKDLMDDKVGVLDIKAKLNNIINCDIEMQVSDHNDIIKRILFYWSKIYAKGIEAGDKDYNILNKTIMILLTQYEIKEIIDIPKIHTKWEIREEEYCKKVLTDALEIHIIELPKLEKILTDNKREKSSLKSWLKFILSPNEVGDEDMENNPEIKKAKEELDKIKQDESEQDRALRRLLYVMDQKAIKRSGYEQGLKQGIEQGIEQGIQKGIEQTQEDIAKKLLEMNIPVEQITKATGLTKEEIEKLKS